MLRFASKCARDLKWAWLVGLIALAAAGLTMLLSLGELSLRGTAPDIQLNTWLRVYISLFHLLLLYFGFCVILGGSGLGEEIAQRTVRLWLLRPRSRTYSVFTMEAVGIAAVALLLMVPLAFLVAANLLHGPQPSHFRSPAPLFLNALLVGTTLFGTTRFLTFQFQSVRLSIATAFGAFIGLHLLPEGAARFIPTVGEFIEPGIVIAARSWPYPVGQLCAWLTLCVLVYAAEVLRFRTLDIRV